MGLICGANDIHRVIFYDDFYDGADLLLARRAFGPQQPVAQDGAVGLAGGLPAHLDGGGRQSLRTEGLHPAGYLDCGGTQETHSQIKE